MKGGTKPPNIYKYKNFIKGCVFYDKNKENDKERNVHKDFEFC